MSDIRSPWDSEPTAAPEPQPAIPSARTGRETAAEPVADVEPLRLAPLLARRQNPWLIVEVDGSAAGHGGLVWALREAARREATVVAVHVLDDSDGDPLGGSGRVHPRTRAAARDHLEAHVLRAIGETGVQGRCRTAVLERPVFDALSAATQGADLVVVGSRGKSLLRHAIPRPLTRRLARGA
ncbi:universal stress protein [Blastococcus litoris]|uniref:universal stress protein n=1 Tax=Blastococcus litoris TaxID=2171622 RepID=UPI0013E0CF5E|nr:universal stress protein [Blastococcus litoris]